MNKLIICKGLPASGKSTWAKAWVKEDPKKRIRVNRDDIRHMLGVYWVPSREKLVTDIEHLTIISAIEKKYDIVVDATNLRGTQPFQALFNTWTWDKDYVMEVKDFTDVPLEVCLERDSLRKEDQVGEDVIMRMYNKHLKK